MRALVVEQDLVTAWGRGIDTCWKGLLTGRAAFSEVSRFPTGPFQAHVAATVGGLDAGAADSFVVQMLSPLLTPLRGRLPDDTLLLLATTVGEVDLLERHILRGAGGPDDSRLDRLLARVRAILGLTGPAEIVSAACASSSAAVARAAGLIASGRHESVLVVACDAVTEFVFSGFSALMALDPDGARPFDKGRKGLTIGEAAGYVHLMSEARAAGERRAARGEVAGWGLSCDANHMTGPSRDGGGLARAIRQALATAAIDGASIGSVCAHGTGTLYNDSMELKAFRQLFGAARVPVYSIKGSVGHTMGAAGLVEMLMTMRSLEEGLVPPSANLREVDPEAEGWVSPRAMRAEGGRVALSTNSGFGGVNAALVVKV